VLDAAVRSFEPVGLDVPWLAVFGNHDAIFAGTFGPVPGPRLDRLEPMLVGAAAKPAGALGLVRAIAHARLFGPDPARWERWAERFPLGIRQVVADPDRRSPVATAEYLAALLDPETRVGPVGHGFTAAHLDRGATWWSRPEGELIQVIGLDTCNHRSGDSGSIGPRQWAWLEEELVRHHRRWRTTTGEWAAGDGPDRLVVLASHHNSWTMHNRNDDPADPGPRKGGRDLLALLARFPNVVLWMNGHSHEHRIIHHRGSEPGTGCWEVDTASAIDFSQQARTFELFDNGDGTLPILVTVLDHASPPGAPHHAHGRWTVSELASLSRELAVNDARWIDPLLLLGGVEDRNVELVLRAPFPLAG
jgi:metallophosphoesterase (TIGR03767 family)